jgi:hypothetical protein
MPCSHHVLVPIYEASPGKTVIVEALSFLPKSPGRGLLDETVRQWRKKYL